MLNGLCNDSLEQRTYKYEENKQEEGTEKIKFI
jgi:hypothetical protein